MNRKTFFSHPLIFLIGGIIGGFLSLVFSSIISLFFTSEEGYFPIFVLVLIEEFVKFAGLSTLLKHNETELSSKFSLLLLQALPFGLGFGLFELILIFLGTRTVPPGAFAIVLVHLITCVFLALAFFSIKVSKKESAGFVYILLAVLIHMWYNTFVISIAN